jgi:hypothetical protein
MSSVGSKFVRAVSLPRLIIGTIWLLVLLAGVLEMRREGPSTNKVMPPVKGDVCASISSFESAPHYRAAREIMVNHRLGDADLDWDDSAGKSLHKAMFVGKYSSCALHTGQPVVSDLLRESPIVQATAGHSTYLLPVTELPQLTGDLDVGSVVDIFEGHIPVVRKIKVLAIQCSNLAADSCSIIVEVTPSEEQLISHVNLKIVSLVRVQP